MFIVQLFIGTNYSFKISKATVYISPFKTNDIKMKTFSLKVTIKVTFPWKKKCYMIIVLTWIMPAPLISIITVPPIWWKKKTLPPNDLSFSKVKSPFLLGGRMPSNMLVIHFSQTLVSSLRFTGIYEKVQVV